MTAPAALDSAFQALAHPTRRAMLRLLATGERTAGDLAAPFQVSLAACSKHVAVLERAGLVERRVEGRRHWLRLVPAPLEEVATCATDLTLAFADNFARLDTVLDDLAARERSEHTPRRRRRS
jgi:DNA-binding transcriptional ArsR family regulator